MPVRWREVLARRKALVPSRCTLHLPPAPLALVYQCRIHPARAAPPAHVSRLHQVAILRPMPMFQGKPHRHWRPRRQQLLLLPHLHVCHLVARLAQQLQAPCHNQVALACMASGQQHWPLAGLA